MVEPLEDYGFFGPDSVTWRVWTHATGFTLGFQRAVVIEELDPSLIAAVDQTGDLRYRPQTRYQRTLRYFAIVAVGDSRSAIKASNMLVKVHAKGVGIEPLSGNRYDANDPDSQLWILMTAWHSALYCYERYGAGKLSVEDERRYWEECAVAAELQTCDPAKVPRTREEVREYFESMRPRLAGSEAAQSVMDYLLDAKHALPPTPLALRPAVWLFNETHRVAAIATMPRWMRKMVGVRQPAAVDVAITPVMRIAFATIQANPQLKLRLIGWIAPSTVPVLAPAVLGIAPRNAETVTPAQARERYGVLPPREEYARFRALVDARTAAGQDTSTDAGPETTESEAILGRVA